MVQVESILFLGEGKTNLCKFNFMRSASVAVQQDIGIDLH